VVNWFDAPNSDTEQLIRPMTEPPWLRRWLFRAAVAAAAALAGAVGLAPLLDRGGEAPEGWARVVALFGRDPALRRTSLAAAAGLLVTACVFFQPTPPPPGPAGR
jgi:hypothetical protein